MRPVKLNINVTRIDKSLLYEGKNGKYLEIVLFENRDGPDQYGNTHTAYQGVTKEQREAGVKGPIIGNARFPDSEPPPRRQSPPGRRPAAPPPSRPAPPPPKQPDPDLDSPEDDIPF